MLSVVGVGEDEQQILTMSKLSFVPRMLPGAQHLLKPQRPRVLAPSIARATGVWSGFDRDYIGHLAHVIIGGAPKTFEVRCIRIRRDFRESATAIKTTGPLALLALFGFLLALGLIALAAVYRDGYALIAVVLVSLASTLGGIAYHGKIPLDPRPSELNVLKGDVVVRWPNGSFTVVKCSQMVAEQLFFGPDTIFYNIRNRHLFRLTTVLAMAHLFLGSILIANATAILQLAFVATYAILILSYGVVSALPPRIHWTSAVFHVEEEGFEDDEDADNDSFTQALWKVIVLTQAIQWVARGDAAPRTRVWSYWLEEAIEKAKGHARELEDENGITRWKVPDWDPQQALREALEDPELNPDLPASSKRM
ncbi:hypothetical protein K490DRAFT_43781 [Saccharata proteae CBS 121410]|uniref:Uncharacterized protein n=1 Tax=Saccharata proteae CBS 121410 TaxID=1314787 RepID=A0A9P4LZA3_9PEZI|nr:hypothetical protein K490DRAFT_43781 [Saccharata proteae CBS 121410]